MYLLFSFYHIYNHAPIPRVQRQAKLLVSFMSNWEKIDCDVMRLDCTDYVRMVQRHKSCPELSTGKVFCNFFP